MEECNLIQSKKTRTLSLYWMKDQKTGILASALLLTHCNPANDLPQLLLNQKVATWLGLFTLQFSGDLECLLVHSLKLYPLVPSILESRQKACFVFPCLTTSFFFWQFLGMSWPIIAFFSLDSLTSVSLYPSFWETWLLSKLFTRYSFHTS